MCKPVSVFVLFGLSLPLRAETPVEFVAAVVLSIPTEIGSEGISK